MNIIIFFYSTHVTRLTLFQLHISNSLCVRGMEMMTPFPVPIHRRLHEIIRVVILTKEKPSLPVPVQKQNTSSKILTQIGASECWSESRLAEDLELLQDGLTQHLADVGFDVHVLEVLKGVGVEQSESGVQSDGHPDAVTMPGQLADLTVLTRVSVKWLLQFK